MSIIIRVIRSILGKPASQPVNTFSGKHGYDEAYTASQDSAWGGRYAN